MFSLLYGLWQFVFSKAEFHVLILGIDKAGKTTLLEKLKSIYSDAEPLPPDRVVPTVGLNIGRVDAYSSKLVFWDLGGQLGLRAIWEKYFEEAHALVFVVDAANQERFEDAKAALGKSLRHKDLEGAPLLIFANKQDLDGAASAEELKRALDVNDVVNGRPRLVKEISAYDGLGVREGVMWLVEEMKRSKRSRRLQLHAGT